MEDPITYYNMNKHLFTRLDMYIFLIKEFPSYRGGFDHYPLERFLSIMLNCDCTDCGGHDISRPCNLETIFSNRYGRIDTHDIV